MTAISCLPASELKQQNGFLALGPLSLVLLLKSIVELIIMIQLTEKITGTSTLTKEEKKGCFTGKGYCEETHKQN